MHHRLAPPLVITGHHRAVRRGCGGWRTKQGGAHPCQIPKLDTQRRGLREGHGRGPGRVACGELPHGHHVPRHAIQRGERSEEAHADVDRNAEQSRVAVGEVPC